MQQTCSLDIQIEHNLAQTRQQTMTLNQDHVKIPRKHNIPSTDSSLILFENNT